MNGALAIAAAPMTGELRAAIDQFVVWLDSFGETSFDHQTFFASDIGRAAKSLYYRNRLLGTVAVAPMIAVEAVFPSARTLFWKRQRFPIADAHYASGFAFLSAATGNNAYYERAVHFLNVLLETRSPSFARHAWGYPFDWVTIRGTFPAGTPMITSIPYMYEAFAQVYALDHNPKWREVLASIADHALLDYRDYPAGRGATSCSYTPSLDDQGRVVNASAYRSLVLTKAAIDFGDRRFSDAAKLNLNFVLQSQNQDGSWYYAMDQEREFVDHFHTCFVLKALAKIEGLTGSVPVRKAIEGGIAYYLRNLFDGERLPKPFSRRPRLTVYRHELYDYAECVNLAVLLAGRFPELDSTLSAVLRDLLARWRKPDGSFRARKLMVGWDNVPMHRWAQAQLFRSLSFLLHESGGA
jgi:hypothetical protein